MQSLILGILGIIRGCGVGVGVWVEHDAVAAITAAHLGKQSVSAVGFMMILIE